MAFVPQNQIPENEQNLFARKDQTTPNPIPPQTGGSSGGGTGGAAAPGMGTSTQFGSNAAKLSDYLKANQEQVGQYGQQVAQNLNQGYNQAMGAVDQGFNNFNQSVNQGYTPANSQLVNQAATNPSDFVKNQDNVKNFQSMYNDQYSGPQNFESSQPYSDVNKQVNDAVQNASLVGNQAGLGTYLNNNMGANDNTEGMRTLDTALLMRSPDASQAIQKAAAPYQNLTGYLSQKTGQADSNVANAKTQADQIRQNVQGQFTGQGGVIDTFKNNLNNQLNQARTGATSRESAALAALNPGAQNVLNTPAQAISDLGLTSDQYQSLVGGNYGLRTPLNLQQYLTQQDPNTQITDQNLASPDQYASMAALSQLTGQDFGSYLSNPKLAGTANLDLSEFQGDKAKADLLSEWNLENPQTVQKPVLPPDNGTIGTPETTQTRKLFRAS